MIILGEELTEIVQLAGGPEQAFQSFRSVVWSAFDWDENGIQIISLGRIAAVLGYCYHLCKTYIQEHLNSADLLTFLGVIAGFLVRFFFQARFYDWLGRQGGWGNLLSQATTGVLRATGTAAVGTSTILFVGLTGVVFAIFLYLKNR